jgi:hypothetical protein
MGDHDENGCACELGLPCMSAPATPPEPAAPAPEPDDAERVAREFARTEVRYLADTQTSTIRFATHLATLLRAVAAEERERCAACCDEPTSLSADQRTRETIAARIRARGEREACEHQWREGLGRDSVSCALCQRCAPPRGAMLADVERLTRELAEARELLAEAWARTSAGVDTCFGCDRWRSQGHAPDCRLAAVLEGT